MVSRMHLTHILIAVQLTLPQSPSTLVADSFLRTYHSVFDLYEEVHNLNFLFIPHPETNVLYIEYERTNQLNASTSEIVLCCVVISTKVHNVHTVVIH